MADAEPAAGLDRLRLRGGAPASGRIEQLVKGRQYRSLLRRLLRHPVTIGTPPQTFTYADAINDVPLDFLDFTREWPAAASQDRYTGPWNRRTASPILVIGNTGDPITPYRAAVAMSRDLARGRLLTVNEFGHAENLNPDACATRYEIRYLETGALPPAGTVCQQTTPPFPAP